MGREEKQKERARGNGSGLLVACWFLLLILLLILFFVKRNVIVSNLEKTDFFGKIFRSQSKGAAPGLEDSAKSADDTFQFDISGNAPKESQAAQVYQEATGSESVRALQEDAIVISQGATGGPRIEGAGKITGEKNSQVPKTASTLQDAFAASNDASHADVPAGEREITLFFVSLNPDGSVSRKSSMRKIARTASPLTDSINELLKGPTMNELSKSYITLIPEGTRLLGASVKNGVATLNFNSQFEINSLGVEGRIFQLMQIVYTATEFDTVSSVQFLIEGEKRDYLGSEGQWIGTPLSRGSF